MSTVYLKADKSKAIEKLTIELIVRYGRKFKEGDVLDEIVRLGLRNFDPEKYVSRKRD